MPESDGQLYIRFLTEGDEDAFRTLFEKHRSGLTLFLYGFVGNENDAEELMMDTFAVLVSGTVRYKVRENAEFRTWLYAIARNQARNWFRKNRLSITSLESGENEADSFASQPEYELLREEKNSEIWKALSKLNTEYRQVLYLMFFEDMKIEEIAQILRKSKKQVYNLVSRAKVSLKSKLSSGVIS